MAAYIQTLKKGNDQIIPRTRTDAITTSDGTLLETTIGNKVDKVTGKGLSTEDYTSAEKTKLSGIAAGAEVNVQSDWSQSDTEADDFIKNKPSIPSDAGDITYDDTETYASGTVGAAVKGKLSIAQGVAHAGKFLVVGSDGNVTTMTMQVWQGGSY